jgi:hypothetical protein
MDIAIVISDVRLYCGSQFCEPVNLAREGGAARGIMSEIENCQLISGANLGEYNSLVSSPDSFALGTVRGYHALKYASAES